ncbi:hypothetical protein L1049_010762 [Liquidambar formosana]|uniref:Retrotransposon gag domain-containing protein n=1 Tax=Liquidambar formosana TaxID=63359 RepID=A0AAP0R2E5_LIQFO
MGVVPWDDFKAGLNNRYGATKFCDFLGELNKLQQIGSVREYQTQFEKLQAKVGHLPQTRQEEEDDGDVIMEEENVGNEVGEMPEISFHAISGVHAPKTMRVRGSIGHMATTVLVDSGSTRNFVSKTLAKKEGLQPIIWGQI